AEIIELDEGGDGDDVPWVRPGGHRDRDVVLAATVLTGSATGQHGCCRYRCNSDISPISTPCHRGAAHGYVPFCMDEIEAMSGKYRSWEGPAARAPSSSAQRSAKRVSASRGSQASVPGNVGFIANVNHLRCVGLVDRVAHPAPATRPIDNW